MGSDGQPSKGVEQAIQSAQAHGIQVVLVSGRGLQGMLPLLKRLNLEGPFIASGGAVIAEAPSRLLIDQRPIPLRCAFELARLGRTRQVSVIFENPDWILSDTVDEELLRDARQFVFRLTVVKDLIRETPSAPTKVTMFGDPRHYQGIIETIKERKLAVSYVQTSPKYIDFYRRGVNKGSAVKRLAKYLGITLKQVMAIGDYYNDLDMFKVAGLSIAMGNAPLEVRQAVHLIAPGNDEGGAAWAISLAIAGSSYNYIMTSYQEDELK
jgi:Cof subfamily protein (haloacid dehalogenase superfamily)